MCFILTVTGLTYLFCENRVLLGVYILVCVAVVDFCRLPTGGHNGGTWFLLLALVDRDL